MSFHGGMLGVLVAIGLFARRRESQSYFTVADIVACAAPIGIFLGRLANFINGELFGRAADPAAVPWAMVFPAHMDPDQIPRHPSQLYEAGLEGILLFLLLFALVRLGWLQHLGRLSAAFLCGYGLARLVGGVLPRNRTSISASSCRARPWDRLLSLPMILIGIGIFLWSQRRAR